MRVLVVGSDEPLVRKMTWILEGDGHAVSTTRTPEDAVVRLRHMTPDVVLITTDLSPEDKNVWIAAIRQQAGMRVIDVIAAPVSTAARRASLADAVIATPFDAETLVGVVDSRRS